MSRLKHPSQIPRHMPLSIPTTNVFFEAHVKVLEFDADFEKMQCILGNYDEFAILTMQDKNKLLGVEKEPLTLIPAIELDRSSHEFPGKSLLPKNRYPDKPVVGKVINRGAIMQDKYKLLGVEEQPQIPIPAKTFVRSHEFPGKSFLPENHYPDKPNVVKVNDSRTTQRNNGASNIPTSSLLFADIKSAKSVSVSHSGTTVSVLVKTASDDNNYSKQNQELSQVTSNSHTTVKPEPVNMLFMTESTPQIKKQTAKITSWEPVSQHIKEKFDVSKSLCKEALSCPSLGYSFGNKNLKHVLQQKKRNGNCAVVNHVRFKHKPKPQMLKSQQKLSMKSFLETSAQKYGQRAQDTNVKRGDDLMSDENPLSNGQERPSKPMSKDQFSPPVPERKSGTLQSKLDSALSNMVNFADNSKAIPIDNLIDEIIEFASIDKLHSPIPNAPIDNTLKIRESVQSLAHEACVLPPVTTAIPANGSIRTKVKPFNIGINLISAILCFVKHSPDFLKSSIVSKTVNNGLTRVDSVVNQCVSEQPMEDSSRDKINANLVKEQHALKLESFPNCHKEQDVLKLESVPNFHKEQDALKLESVPNSHKRQDALKLESVSNSPKEMSDSLSHSDIGTKKHKLSIKQYEEAVKRQKTSLESQPKVQCTDMAKLLINPDDFYRLAKNYKCQADSMKASIRKYVLYVEAALCYLQCGYTMEKSKIPRINEAMSMYIDTNKFVAHNYKKLVAFQDQDTTGKIKLKLIVLCLWIQSFIHLKLFMLKKTEPITPKQALDDHFKQDGDKTSSKVFSAGPNLQGQLKVPQGPVLFPQKLHSITQKYVNYTGYLKQGYDLWTQANSAITTDIKEFFQEIDKSNGPLTMHSGFGNMIQYIKAAIANSV